MLHGLPSYQTAPMPIWGLSRSAQERPVAISMAWEAPWLAGWVMREENLLSLAAVVAFALALGVVIGGRSLALLPAGWQGWAPRSGGSRRSRINASLQFPVDIA